MASAERPVKRERSFWYSLTKLLARILSPLLFPVRYHGLSNIVDAQAPFVLASNHVSLIDPALLAMPIKRYELRFLGKRELGKTRLARFFLRKLHMISVARHTTDMAAMRASNEVLRSGHVLAIFPEGTRTKPEQMMKQVESGFALIVLRNRVPLYPALIQGRPGPFRMTHVHFLPPLDYAHIVQKGTGKEACDELSELLKHSLWQARAASEGRN